MEPIKKRNAKKEPIRTKTHMSHRLASAGEDSQAAWYPLHVLPHLAPFTLVFPRLEPVRCVFPALRTGYMILRACHRNTCVFPRLAPVAYFPALGTGF